MKSSTLSALALASALSTLAAPSFAQGYDNRAGYDDEIVVTAPREERDAATGARIEHITASRPVEVADLDLRYNGDVAELRRRVRDASIDACDEIEASSAPNEQITTHAQCIRDAERSAMAQADDAIAYARG